MNIAAKVDKDHLKGGVIFTTDENFLTQAMFVDHGCRTQVVRPFELGSLAQIIKDKVQASVKCGLYVVTATPMKYGQVEICWSINDSVVGKLLFDANELLLQMNMFVWI